METTGVEVVRTVALNVLAALQIASHYYPETGVVNDGATFDYVIVGGGTAGCILASRLTENSNVTVALIESGSQQPFESVYPGYYPLLPGSSYDYNFYTEQDDYTSQEIQGKSARIKAGKMLGGTSGLHKMFHTRSNRRDYRCWVEETNDESWSYDEMLKYHLKSETLEDSEILKTPDAANYGKNGPIRLNRQPFDANQDIIKSFEELGYISRLDLNGNKTLGVAEPLFQISKDGIRQSTAESYLLAAKGRPNLSVFTLTTATKVIFDSDKNAIGVEVVNCQNKTVKINANREVVISAGVMKSAQLLLLSGIGPAEYIESWGIDVVNELPVGLAIRDQVGSVLAYKLKPSNEGKRFNYKQFPIANTIALKAMKKSAVYPDYESINMYFPQNSSMLSTVCSRVLRYVDEVCDRYVAANKEGDLFLASIIHLYTVSTGKVYLRNEKPLSEPWIYMGAFSNPKDLDKLTTYVKDFVSIENTEFFKNANAEFVDLDLYYCNHLKGTSDFWKCYARSMSDLVGQTVASAPMGTVVDSDLTVFGVQKLRVVDAAAIPCLSSGDIITNVIALAEKAADMIKGEC